MIPYVLIFIATLIFYPLIFGIRNSLEFEFRLEIKVLSSQYYILGLFFVEHETEDPDYVEQEFTIALFFVTFVFVFYKLRDHA